MMRAGLVGVMLLVAIACGKATKEPARPAGHEDAQGSAAVNKTPDDGGGSFVRGPELTPADKLVAWLDEQKRGGEPKLVRLPISLAKRGPKFSTVGARVGGAADALPVFLDDSALGIGIADRARTQCKDAPTCAMWVEGYWRGKDDAGGYTFQVMTVRDPIAADELATARYAEVQGESGN